MALLRKKVIMIYLIITVPLYGQYNGGSVQHRIYKYATAEKIEIETIQEYMDMFQDMNSFDLERYFYRNDSVLRNFMKYHYFQTRYRGFENKVFVEITVSYRKPLFNFQKEQIIEIHFNFGYFPTLEDDGITERDVRSLVEATVNEYMSQFDVFVSNNDIKLSRL